MLRIIHCNVIVALLSLTCLWSANARADAQNKAAAESLYRDALNQMTAGNYESACPKLAESQRFEPAVGTLLYLGECYERLGLTASAWATFTTAVDAAKRVNNRERERIALERATRLADKVSRLTLIVPPDAQVVGLEVKQDGRIMGKGAWGMPLPVDPGTHVLEAAAPGHQVWTKRVDISATSRADVIETLPLLAEAVPQATPTPIPEPVAKPAERRLVVESKPVFAPRVPLQAAKSCEDETSSSLRKHAGLALGGLGIVAIGIGTVFGFQARSKEKDSEAYCWSGDKSRCSPEGVERIDDARTAAIAANVGFVSGALAIAGGALVYFTAPGTPQPKSTQALGINVVPDVSPGRSAVHLHGRF